MRVMRDQSNWSNLMTTFGLIPPAPKGQRRKFRKLDFEVLRPLRNQRRFTHGLFVLLVHALVQTDVELH